MTSIIHTQKERCRGCYACVRGCPTKAIKVENRLAEVMPDLCINCGTCVRVCVTRAKTIESDIEVVHNLLASNSNVVAILSSSFPAALPGIRPGQFVSALKELGFSEVMEDAFGAELVSREYLKLLAEKKEGPIFSSTCPAVVSYIEKFYPQLTDNLAPIVSPMIAMGRLIKQANPRAKVVFIGPCAAKKAESKDERVTGVIDAVLTFPEIMDMFIASMVDLKTLPEGKFSGPKPNQARLFAISGGLLKMAGLSDDIVGNEIINAHGRDYVISLLAEIARGDIHTHFINFFFCHGCINGPAIDNSLSIFRRRELVAKYTKADSDPKQTELDIKKYSHLDLRRQFKAAGVSLPAAVDKDIQDALLKMGKSSRVNRFNCGACGYRTCQELAAAVARGQAEITMCWPHLLAELKETQAGLIQAEKLTSLGQMAASIAHEVNNPLSGVLVYTQLLNKKITNDTLQKDVAQNYLTKMESELNRSTKLIRNLLDFARQSPPSLRETDINDVVTRSLELVVNSAQLKQIKIIQELAPGLPKFKADPDQIQQVCINLILNAVQAMSAGGTLTLRTDYEKGQ
ncbi:MAG TPA: [Fe-Fe] hydrogenase large subunit C-terminal domain-containing protein, partial [Dehalococcoidales bacterium]